MRTIRIFLFSLYLFLGGNFLFAQIECPSLVFLPVVTECGSGDAIVSFKPCRDYGNSQLDHVTWDMGDGTPTFETSDMSVSYTYAQNGNYHVTAFATFILKDGTSCVSPVFSSCDNHSEQYSFQFVPIFMLNGYLSVLSSGEIYSNTSYAIFINYFENNLSFEGFNFQLLVDGNVVSSTTTPPESGTAVGSFQFSEGQHVIEYVFTYKNSCSFSFVLIIDVIPPPLCSACFTFKPESGKPYWVSAWVKEVHKNPVMNYSDAFVEIEFAGSASAPVNFHTTGEIIDGWQRIVGEFVIPDGTTELKIYLSNVPGNGNAFFDDVRIHPFNASMKSYVYDPVTFLLTAELDDNNYATFYEYDKEGQLIRIKKETARGVMTIQESRSSNPKN